MATQTRSPVSEQPLNVVLRPRSRAEAAYRSAVLAPGFEPRPGLDLRYLGGRTIARLTFTNVYLGRWDAAEREQLDHALSAATADPHLNNVLAQYFKGTTVTSTFAGSRTHARPLPARVYKDTVEAIVTGLDQGGALAGLDLRSTAVCLLLPEDAVLVDGGSHDDDPVDSTRLLGWYSPHGGEIGDVPLSEAGADLSLVMKEVPLADGSGTVPIQLMWSNAVGGPEGPTPQPHRVAAVA